MHTISRYYFIVYKTINITNDKIYIGKRYTKNLNDGYLGSGIHIKRAVKKYGKNNFYREIVEFCKNKRQLNEREIFWIAELDARNPNIGYNVSRGGDGANLEHLTEESKKKIGEKNRINNLGEKNGMFGKHHTEESKQKSRLSHLGQPSGMKGKHHKEESKEKTRKTLTGRKQARETGEKRSKSMIGKNVGKYTELVTCPYCNKVGGINAMKRWHFDNCRYKPKF
jgi:group I intron endonuclease